MTAGDLLMGLLSSGVDLQYTAHRLRFRAPTGGLSPERRESVATLRAELIALVENGAVLPWDISAWPEFARDTYEERAAIREFDGGAARQDAERDAERDVRVDHARVFLGCALGGAS